MFTSLLSKTKDYFKSSLTEWHAPVVEKIRENAHTLTEWRAPILEKIRENAHTLAALTAISAVTYFFIRREHNMVKALDKSNANIITLSNRIEALAKNKRSQADFLMDLYMRQFELYRQARSVGAQLHNIALETQKSNNNQQQIVTIIDRLYGQIEQIHAMTALNNITLTFVQRKQQQQHSIGPLAPNLRTSPSPTLAILPSLATTAINPTSPSTSASLSNPSLNISITPRTPAETENSSSFLSHLRNTLLRSIIRSISQNMQLSRTETPNASHYQ